jgi:glycine oxidase
MPAWDTIIVGQGLAGSTLAWCLHDAGQRVLLVDAEPPVTSSGIAAGLITPITGGRLALGWRYAELMPQARAFYRCIEARTGAAIYHERTAVRILVSDIERQHWAKRAQLATFQTHLLQPQPEPLLDAELADTSAGGFAMHTAQVDVPAYLRATQNALPYRSMPVDWEHDVVFDNDAVSVQGVTAHRIISCEGFGATSNPHFAWVPFRAAKGDILTVRFARPVPAVTIHCGVWVAPTAEPDVFRVGATYNFDVLDCVPSAAGRAQIEAKLRAVLRVPYTVLGHAAAVRPIIHQSQPVMGLHPTVSRLGLFNGLGSKGALLAPGFAALFAAHILHNVALPAESDVRKFR